MKLLLDTHIWLWMNAEPWRLSAQARAAIDDVETERLLSLASCWEIAIKYSRNRLPLPSPPAVYIPRRLDDTAITLLPITLAHVLGVSELPPHHRDPFDRVLVAQAMAEGATIVTADAVLAAYGVPTIAS